MKTLEQQAHDLDIDVNEYRFNKHHINAGEIDTEALQDAIDDASTMKIITPQKDNYELEVYEHSCGFHIGLDGSYLEQEGDIKMTCPACGGVMNTKGTE